MKQGVPISPSEFLLFKKTMLPPPEIFDVINDLLIENLCFTVQDIIDRMSRKCPNLVYSKVWLNFQESYKSKGWTIQYDPKDQTFEFTVNK
jgi:hypothetical protein